MTRPLVSAIVTCYNRQAYLAEALDSILAQTFDAYEIVLVDDGSTDDSARIAARYVERHGDRIRYHHQENRGASVAKNIGVELAAGAYLAFLDSDDRWTPDKLAVQMRHVDRHPDIPIRYAHGRQFLSPELTPEAQARLHCPTAAMPAPTSGTLLLARDTFIRVGPFRTDLKVGIDIEWNLRARATDLGMITLPEVLLDRRIHNGNSGFTHRNEHKQHAAIVKEHLDRMRGRKTRGSE